MTRSTAAAVAGEKGEPEDLARNLILQLGVATEALNRRWYEASGPLDGRDPGRHGRGHRGGVRGQVHAAVAIHPGALYEHDRPWSSCKTVQIGVMSFDLLSLEGCHAAVQ
jgi:hypothetical protein